MGQSQGSARAEPVRRRLPRARQHRRVRPLASRCPTGGHLEQADGTAWMAFYCATMLSMALELAADDPSYEDIASKFFEHFVAITDAMNSLGGTGLWDERGRLLLRRAQRQRHDAAAAHPLDGRHHSAVRRRSARTGRDRPAARLQEAAGLVPQASPGPRPAHHATATPTHAKATRASTSHRLLAIPSRDRLVRVLRYVLDENGIPLAVRRPLAVAVSPRPSVPCAHVGGMEHRVDYVAGRIDHAACSAATRTGAGRSGFR